MNIIKSDFDNKLEQNKKNNIVISEIIDNIILIGHSLPLDTNSKLKDIETHIKNLTLTLIELKSKFNKAVEIKRKIKTEVENLKKQNIDMKDNLLKSLGGF